MSDLLTAHAERRTQQRGIQPDLIELIVAFCDVEFSVGADCHVLRMSRKEAEAFAISVAQPQLAKRLSSVAVIDSGTSGRVVSVLRDQHGRNGRRYRRPQRGRNARYRIRRRPRKSSGVQ